MEKVQLTTFDGLPLTARVWIADSPKATIQILHGMAEHCERYQPFAEYLQAQGFNLIAHNHRGHGERLPQGHFKDSDGWKAVLEDVSSVQKLANPNLPIFLFGHSMGSFIARSWAANYAHKLKGLILSGSNQQNPALFYMARTLAKGLSLVNGQKAPSKLMDFLSFGEFNKAFKPNKTQFDWLSGDETAVQAYINDPQCGFLCSTQFWVDFMGGLIEVNKIGSLEKLPNSLPVLLLSGEKDPVGRMGKGVPLLAQKLYQTGHSKVELKLYPDGRHEMLNEVNAAQVFADILQWLEKSL